MASSEADIVETKTSRCSLFYQMGSLLNLILLCVLIYWIASVASRTSKAASGSIVEGTVFINGTASIGITDHDFVCATLDWWPPDKCDYGTCSWGPASLLNLVSSSSKSST